MATSRKQERRLLTKDELDLVGQTHQPQLAALEPKDIDNLVKLLRERRDRARGIADRQRRSTRGKTTGAPPAPEGADRGNRRKAAILNEALARLQNQRSRKSPKDRLIANARKALAMRKAMERPSRPVSSRRADKGMQPKPNRKAQRIGSAMEAGRVSQFVRDAQAKRDDRQDNA